MNAFLELFSDEAATPRAEFLNNLHANYVRVASGGKLPRLSTRRKILLGVSIVALVLALLALVLLPRRDMSDPRENSLIESVVEQSQENVENFTQGPAAQQNTQQDEQQPQRSTTQDSQTNTSTSPTSTDQPVSTMPTPPNSPSSPTPLAGFSAAYWNIDVAELAGPPSIPVSPAQFTQSVSSISFAWGAGSPNPLIQNDGFVAQFTKEASIPSGQYKVEFSSDNGLRMHVNESVVFDRWYEAAPSGIAYFNTDPAVPLTSIMIDYYELDGSANISVIITKL